MRTHIAIGIDLMGSDQPPQAIFEAVLEVSQELDATFSLIVFVHKSYLSDLQKQYQSFGCAPCKLQFVVTSEVIEMQDAPLLAVRRKKNSTMAEGVRYLKDGRLNAFVSTGNTGALITTAMLHLPLLPTIERPALLVMLPTGNGGVAVLDVGANVMPSPRHLLDDAKLGVAYRQIIHQIRSPKVGLLNIGAEEQKGTKAYQEAYRLLNQHFKKSFRGNIEGREVFQGKIDVLVTDGFTGNVFLKTCEGVSLFLMDYMHMHFSTEKSQEIKNVVQHLHQKFNYSKHPGALLAGMDGIIVKCHGHSSTLALMNGIRGAIHLAKLDIIRKIKHKLT